MEAIRIVSVNAGSAETISLGNRSMTTGINKLGIEGRIRVSEAGLESDVICDRKHHGGADQAIYVYSVDDYAWWSAQLGRELRSGTFGENLTIEGLPRDMNVGDRLLIGDVILETTSPRIPCRTLSAQMQDRNFGLAFRRAERPGFYFRVLNGGDVGAGDAVTFVENPGCDVSTLELFRLHYEIHPQPETLQKMLAAPVAERMRANLERKLAASAR
ncbi:MAG: MOSC domain-containing protein [Woeseiaceae bacterium]